MSEFLDTAFTMPTTLWSILLILVGIYWLISMFGIFNFEMLDGALDATEALDGLADAADGVLDGADGMLDGADGMLDGAEGAMDLDPHASFFERAGFGEIPRIITLSLTIFFGWIVSFFGTDWIVDAGRFTFESFWVVLGMGVVSLGGGLVGTAIAIQPLRRVVKFHGGPTRRELIGGTCTVKTTRVDLSFGQAEASDGQLIQVRSKDGEGIGYGTRCVIFDYDAEKEVFYVSKLDEELG